MYIYIYIDDMLFSALLLSCPDDKSREGSRTWAGGLGLREPLLNPESVRFVREVRISA